MRYLYNVDLNVYNKFDGDKSIVRDTIVAHNQDELKEIIKTKYSDFEIIKIEAVIEIE